MKSLCLRWCPCCVLLGYIWRTGFYCPFSSQPTQSGVVKWPELVETGEFMLEQSKECVCLGKRGFSNIDLLLKEMTVMRGASRLLLLFLKDKMQPRHKQVRQVTRGATAIVWPGICLETRKAKPKSSENTWLTLSDVQGKGMHHNACVAMPYSTCYKWTSENPAAQHLCPKAGIPMTHNWATWQLVSR